MKKLVLIVFVIAVAISCKKEPSFTIRGKITNADVSKIYLEKLALSGPIPFDSAKIDNQGNFKLTGKVSFPTFFLLKLNENKFITLLIDSMEKVTFAADFTSFASDYKIEGSIGSQKVQELNQKLDKTNSKLDSINSLINLSQNDFDFEYRLEKWQKEKYAIATQQVEYSQKFVADNPFSLASILAIYQRFNDNNYIIQDLQTIKIAASALHTMYPESEHAKALYDDTKNMMKSASNLQMKQFIQQHGKNSPDIVLPDKNGKEVALSSFLGKHVLLHFWSVNDKSSRIMNEVLKENYAQFRSKGFEIYQVSIDSIKSQWVRAIEEDGLSWTNVGDMSGSITALNNYNITSIPSNYLLDKEGNIVAKDLKGPALHNALSKLLN
jgi:peroxiredoxin